MGKLGFYVHSLILQGSLPFNLSLHLSLAVSVEGKVQPKWTFIRYRIRPFRSVTMKINFSLPIPWISCSFQPFMADKIPSRGQKDNNSSFDWPSSLLRASSMKIDSEVSPHPPGTVTTRWMLFIIAFPTQVSDNRRFSNGYRIGKLLPSDMADAASSSISPFHFIPCWSATVQVLIRCCWCWCALVRVSDSRFRIRRLYSLDKGSQRVCAKWRRRE